MKNSTKQKVSQKSGYLISTVPLSRLRYSIRAGSGLSLNVRQLSADRGRQHGGQDPTCPMIDIFNNHLFISAFSGYHMSWGPPDGHFLIFNHVLSLFSCFFPPRFVFFVSLFNQILGFISAHTTASMSQVQTLNLDL